MSTSDHNDGTSVVNSPQTRPRFQFSIRDLLVTTTIVSICLAVGVHFVGFMAVVGALCVTQVAVLLASDWLIRPENRRALAFVSAGTWAILGSGLFALAFSALYQAAISANSQAPSTLAICLAIGAGLSWFMAAYRWRKMTRS
jgi:hypothetical protein